MKILNRIIKILAIVSLLSSIMTISVLAEDDISVVLNGSKMDFDVPPQIINERTMVPLRAIFEALGAEVDWNSDTKTVTSEKDGTTIKLTIDNPTMYINDKAVTLDAPGCIIDGRTLVPVRAISEAYGIQVGWNGDTRTVLIGENSDLSSQPVSYLDISANVAQINEFIDNGMYLEAMQECENAKVYNISDDDRNILSELYNTAQSKYDDYNAQAKIAGMEKNVVDMVTGYIINMKNPASAKLYSVYAGYYDRNKYNKNESGEAFAVIIDIAGENSFGGTTRDDKTLLLNPSTGDIIIDLESYAEKQAKSAFGAKRLAFLDMSIEALELQNVRYTEFNEYNADDIQSKVISKILGY